MSQPTIWLAVVTAFSIWRLKDKSKLSLTPRSLRLSFCYMMNESGERYWNLHLRSENIRLDAGGTSEAKRHRPALHVKYDPNFASRGSPTCNRHTPDTLQACNPVAVRVHIGAIPSKDLVPELLAVIINNQCCIQVPRPAVDGVLKFATHSRHLFQHTAQAAWCLTRCSLWAQCNQTEVLLKNYYITVNFIISSSGISVCNACLCRALLATY